MEKQKLLIQSIVFSVCLVAGVLLCISSGIWTEGGWGFYYLGVIILFIAAILGTRIIVIMISTRRGKRE
jgi:hypothetical protein